MSKYFIPCITVLLALRSSHAVVVDDTKHDDAKKTQIPPSPPPPKMSCPTKDSATTASDEDKEGAKKTPFQNTAETIMYGDLPGFVEFWHLPHFMAWGKCKSLYGTKIESIYQEEFKRFPGDLLKSLRSEGSVDQLSARLFLKMYVTWSRARAAHFGDVNLSSAMKLSLAPHTGKIKESLTAGLNAKSAKTRMQAAVLLLCLDANDTKANEILRAYQTSTDEELLDEALYILGVGQLASPQAIDFLAHMLKHPKKSVRESAAGAVITMGTSARDLAPALVAFLETGKDAEGKYYYPFAIAMPRHGNLALMALESLKQYARPALPVIFKRFADSNDEDQVAMLACLAHIGKENDACLKLMRTSMSSDKIEVKLASACALLHLVPEDTGALEILTKALGHNATTDIALETSRQFAPPSRKLVTSLIPLLKHKESRDDTLRVLFSIGPSAGKAVPAIEKLFAFKGEGVHWEPQLAAYALAAIRGNDAAAALLRIADAKGSAAQYAAAQYALVYLPELGDDLPPNAPAILIRAIENDDKPKGFANYFGSNKTFAAIALSNLGERTRSVRRDMERLVNDPEAGWILDTALRRLPEKGR